MNNHVTQAAGVFGRTMDVLGDVSRRIKLIEDYTANGFGTIRVPDGPRVEIAIAHDGALEGVIEAERLSFAIAALPDCIAVLRAAAQAWGAQFDAGDEEGGEDRSISGADLVEWFTTWPNEAKEALAASLPPSRPEET